MALIFDSFPSAQQARKFAATVKKRYGLRGLVVCDEADVAKLDIFTRTHLGGFWEPILPVVHIERVDVDSPADIPAIKKRFGLTNKEVTGTEVYTRSDGSTWTDAETNTAVAAERRVEDLAKEFGCTFLGT
jgi:hypothetical protein